MLLPFALSGVPWLPGSLKLSQGCSPPAGSCGPSKEVRTLTPASRSLYHRGALGTRAPLPCAGNARRAASSYRARPLPPHSRAQVHCPLPSTFSNLDAVHLHFFVVSLLLKGMLSSV